MGARVDVRDVNGSDMISALRLSQQAPAILGSGSSSKASSSDTAEEYGRIEQLFLACVRTGDDKSAQMCLDRLSRRFGASNEKVMGLQGLYKEATAKDQKELEKCLEDYDNVLSQNPVNVVRYGGSPFS